MKARQPESILLYCSRAQSEPTNLNSSRAQFVSSMRAYKLECYQERSLSAESQGTRILSRAKFLSQKPSNSNSVPSEVSQPKAKELEFRPERSCLAKSQETRIHISSCQYFPVRKIFMSMKPAAPFFVSTSANITSELISLK